MSPSRLFSKYDSFALTTNSVHPRVKKEVDALSSEQVLKIAEDDLVAYVFSKLEMSTPVLMEDEVHFDQKEIQVDARRFPGNRMFFEGGPHYVPGTRIKVYIPFHGEADVFHVQPSLWSSAGYPIADVIGSEVVLTYEQEKPDGASIKKQYLATIGEINKYLGSLANSFEGFNKQIEPIARQCIKQRREMLLAAASIGDALGLPQKASGNASVTYAIDLKKLERPTINLPVAKAVSKPEPVLSQSDYDYVLRVMRLMSETMEKAPKSFVAMDEESIRDNFLVHINAQYDGMASGEAFNFSGKTDILLKVDGRCVFVAECKFWTGEKGFLETIDQLLGYLSWRDTKVAVVILNRNKNFSAVLETIAEAVPKHKCFIEYKGVENETSFRYEFRQPNDAQRKIQLTVMAFDVPSTN